MPNVAQRSFAGGEISPSLYARTDIVKFATGCRKLENMFIQRHGGIANRPGTEFIVATKYPDKHARLVSFIFNADQTYVLEFGERYVRFIRNGSQIEVGGLPYE